MEIEIQALKNQNASLKNYHNQYIQELQSQLSAQQKFASYREKDEMDKLEIKLDEKKQEIESLQEVIESLENHNTVLTHENEELQG